MRNYKKPPHVKILLRAFQAVPPRTFPSPAPHVGQGMDPMEAAELCALGASLEQDTGTGQGWGQNPEEALAEQIRTARALESPAPHADPPLQGPFLS